MYSIQTLNKISGTGLDRLPRDNYETATHITDPDAIIVRSAKMHDTTLPARVKAIARAGAGTNNIPVEACTEKGVVVFNTPGANANSVKELVIAGLFISSRKIFRGMTWAKSLISKGDEIPSLVEKGKKEFTGPEIKGKTLGIIGLGAIGVQVANAAEDLGMSVYGYDPFLSVEAAWGLSRKVKRAASLDQLLSKCNYISLHVPLTDKTRGMINKEKLALTPGNVRILNFARGGLVNNKDMIEALQEGTVARYVTDFPDEALLKEENVMAMPHLGASTPEAEENCAVMAVDQLREFLEKGNIKNSVNFPNCSLECSGKNRLVIANRNVPNMLGQISTILAHSNLNILDLVNRHRDKIAYNIIDVEEDIPEKVLEDLMAVEGIIMTRVIPNINEA